MIFLTVGAQMPFDRLVRGVDDWAERTGRDDVFAQIGRAGSTPRHLRWTPFLRPAEFRETARNARLIIAHAGMGTILSALQFGRPILVVPRRADLRETRNDHQVATANRFRSRGGCRRRGRKRTQTVARPLGEHSRPRYDRALRVRRPVGLRQACDRRGGATSDRTQSRARKATRT